MPWAAASPGSQAPNTASGGKVGSQAAKAATSRGASSA